MPLLSIPHAVETTNEAGELLSVNQFSVFIVGAGGFGGKRTSQHAKVCMSHTVHVHPARESIRM